MTISAPVMARVEPGCGDQAARLRSLAEGAKRPVSPRADINVTTPLDARSGWPKIVAIGSGKGGVGKTAIAVNLSIALSRRGLRVTLVDGDLGTANVDVVCGLSPARRLDAAMRDRSDRREGVPLTDLSISSGLGFRLVPGAAASVRAADVSGAACLELAGALETLGGEADIVVVDAGAGIGIGVRAWMHAADLPLIVATPEPAAIADAYGLMKCLRLEDLRTSSAMSLVLNQTGGRAEVDRVVERLGAVTRRFLRTELRLMGSLSWDRDVILAARTRSPLLATQGRSRFRREITELADSVSRQLAVPARAMAAR